MSLACVLTINKLRKSDRFRHLELYMAKPRQFVRGYQVIMMNQDHDDYL